MRIYAAMSDRVVWSVPCRHHHNTRRASRAPRRTVGLCAPMSPSPCPLTSRQSALTDQWPHPHRESYKTKLDPCPVIDVDSVPHDVRIYNSKLEIPKCRILFLFFYSGFCFYSRIYNSKLEIPKCRILFLFFYSGFCFYSFFRKANKYNNTTSSGTRREWLLIPLLLDTLVVNTHA
jgi:hypothetical protein